MLSACVLILLMMCLIFTSKESLENKTLVRRFVEHKQWCTVRCCSVQCIQGYECGFESCSGLSKHWEYVRLEIQGAIRKFAASLRICCGTSFCSLNVHTYAFVAQLFSRMRCKFSLMCVLCMQINYLQHVFKLYAFSKHVCLSCTCSMSVDAQIVLL